MPWKMIAVSIGAQLFNSWQTNKKNEELQTRQKEFQKAAQQKEFDRMRQLQREAAKLALEIEAEVHEQRLEDIQKNYDDAVKNLATEIAIKKWPLKVLPFVMRGESFGTFFNGSKSILMHTIFTPSNCESFNNAVYADIDLQLEAECNEHWNVQSSHPIAYYGGAWRKSKLDLDQIDLLRTQLKNVPTVVISPYFAPELYFRVKIWGMGKDTEVKIELPQGIFSYEYTKGMNYSPNNETPQGDLKATTIEEFVPYLECLIGYIADVYYWMMYKVLPCLPQIFALNYKNWNKTLMTSYQSGYTNALINKMSNESISTLSDIQKYINYIELLRESGELIQVSNIENALVKYVSDTYVARKNDIDIPKSYKEILRFMVDESKIDIDFEHVPITKYEDKFDLLAYLQEFKKIIISHADRLDTENISLYIEQRGYTHFKLYILDMNIKTIINIDGFNYIIITKRPLYYKKIKNIFKHKSVGSVICRFCRVDKLIEELMNYETLIF